jgi:phenylacetate-coenzyme A ligase PaaK-like adenylate-forming protein
MIAAVLWKRSRLRRHEWWSRARLDHYRSAKLRELRRFAVQRSPFYANLHRGLEGSPLEELPVVTKQAMDEHFANATIILGEAKKNDIAELDMK